MDFLRDNWFWIVVITLFIWMHAGHGMHGRHRGNRGSARAPRRDERETHDAAGHHHH